MPVTDNQVIVLRALLADDQDLHKKLYAQLDRDRDSGGYIAMVSGAFARAVHVTRTEALQGLPATDPARNATNPRSHTARSGSAWGSAHLRCSARTTGLRGWCS